MLVGGTVRMYSRETRAIHPGSGGIHLWLIQSLSPMLDRPGRNLDVELRVGTLLLAAQF